MTTLREAAQQALEALKDDQYRLVEVSPNQYEYKTDLLVEVGPNQYEYKTDLAIAALERALAQQAEPVEPRRWEGDHNIESPFNACMHKSYCMTLKQALAQRAPLTDEKISDLWCEVSNTDFVTADTHVFARAIERAHGIKE